MRQPGIYTNLRHGRRPSVFGLTLRNPATRAGARVQRARPHASAFGAGRLGGRRLERGPGAPGGARGRPHPRRARLRRPALGRPVGRAGRRAQRLRGAAPYTFRVRGVACVVYRLTLISLQLATEDGSGECNVRGCACAGKLFNLKCTMNCLSNPA